MAYLIILEQRMKHLTIVGLRMYTFLYFKISNRIFFLQAYTAFLYYASLLEQDYVAVATRLKTSLKKVYGRHHVHVGR